MAEYSTNLSGIQITVTGSRVDVTPRTATTLPLTPGAASAIAEALAEASIVAVANAKAEADQARRLQEAPGRKYQEDF